MPWLNFGGHTAAEFPLSIGASHEISPYLLHPQNQWADVLKTIAPAIRDYIDKKKNDAIANEIMNMQNPPRAEAVDPSLQGAPATTPATGGADQFKAHQMFQAILDKQQADKDQSTSQYWQNLVREKTANKLQAEADAPDNRIPIPLPDGRTALVTGNEAANYYKPRAGGQDSIDKIDRDMLAWTGHHLSDFITSKDARNNPDGSATMTLADGKTQVVIPSDALQSVRDRYARLKTPQGAQMYQSKLPAPDLPPDTTTPTPPNPNEQVVTSPQSDPYVPGKKYRDKNGNVATYLGNGQWR